MPGGPDLTVRQVSFRSFSCVLLRVHLHFRMDSVQIEPSVRLQLALLGVVILNMAIGVLHLVRFMFWPGLNLWGMLPIVTILITLFMSWMLLQLVDVNHINFGFQLGVLWMGATFLFDLGLYLFPKPGGILHTIKTMWRQLAVHYGVIVLTPMVVGIIYYFTAKRKG